MEISMKTYLRAGVLAVALAAGAFAAARAEVAPPSAAAAVFGATTLSLGAYGETKIAPDMASISLGVTNTASAAAKAMSDNAAQMAKVMAALRAGGIAAKDIRTSGLSVNPQYAYEQGQSPRLTGYQASDQLTVTVHDLARLGATIDASVGAGATQVNGISFGLADPTAAENAARELAVHALQAKAELYARATGYRLSRLVTLNEGGSEGVRLPPLPIMAAQSRMQAVPTTVAPGELTIRIDITGLYELAR
jgi:uncharacterized protein YggE